MSWVRSRLPGSVVTTLLLSALVGHAQDLSIVSREPVARWPVVQRPALNGLRSLYVADVIATDEDRECGARPEQLKLAVARPLLDGGLLVTEDVAAPWVTVWLNSIRTTDASCAVSLQVRVLETAWYAAAYQQSPALSLPANKNGDLVFVTLGPIEIFRNAVLLTGARSRMGDRIEKSVREFVDEFVTKVKLANQ